MKNLFVLFSLFGILIGVTSFASGWARVVPLKDADNNTIIIDYQTPMAVGNSVAVASIFVNAYYPCNGELSADVVSYCGAHPYGPFHVSMAIQENNGNGSCHYSNSSPVDIVNATQATAGPCDHTIKLTFNGKPVIDSFSNKDRFEFKTPFVQ